MTVSGRDNSSQWDLAAALAVLAVPVPDGFVDRVLRAVREQPVDHYVVVDSPAGPLIVAFNEHGLTRVGVASGIDGTSGFELRYHELHGRAVNRTDRNPTGLTTALRTGRARQLRLDLTGRSAFEQDVLTKTLEIPRGEVRTYSWIAQEINRPRAVRAVGAALGRNPIPVLIPCHRIVRADGQIGGYIFGGELKRTLLEHEGVNLDELVALAERGVHLVGSGTTKIFCHPSCKQARRISARHRVLFGSENQARAAGYRPCLRCRPAAA